MGLTLVTPATSSVVTLEDAQAWSRADGPADEAALTIALEAAISAVETFLGRSLGAQTWRLVLDDFTAEILLPRGPVTGIEAFTYLDTAGADQAVDPEIYTLDLVSDPQRIVINDDASWPEVDDAINAVSIEFTAGYAALPSAVRMVILTLTTQAFDDRTAPALTPDMMRSLAPWRPLRI